MKPVDADARGGAEQKIEVKRYNSNREWLGEFIGEHHVRAKRSAEGREGVLDFLVLLKFPGAHDEKAEIQLFTRHARIRRHVFIQLSRLAGLLELLGKRYIVLVLRHGFVVGLGLGVFPVEGFRLVLGNQRAAPGHGDIARGVVIDLRQVPVEGQVHIEYTRNRFGQIEIEANAFSNDRHHGVAALLAGIDGLIHLGAHGRQLGLDLLARLLDGEIGRFILHEAGGQDALEVLGIDVTGFAIAGIRGSGGLHRLPFAPQMRRVEFLVVQYGIHGGLCIGVVDHQLEADVFVHPRGYLGFLGLIHDVVAVEGTAVGVGLRFALRVGPERLGLLLLAGTVVGAALRLRAGEQGQVIPQYPALAHQGPGDVKAAVARGAGVHLEAQLYAVVVVVDKTGAIEHDVAALGINRCALEDRIGVFVVPHRHLDAHQGLVVHAVELQGELVHIDDRDVDVPGVGVVQHAAARAQAGQAGIAAGEPDLVRGHAGRLGRIPRGQQRMKPL